MTRTAEQPSLGDLVTSLSEQTSALVRDELRLARLEMTSKAKYAGLGAGLFGGGALFALLGIGTLVAAAVLGLATAMPGWAAALVVAGLLLAAAAVSALLGKKEISQAVPAVPEETVASVKDDLKAVKR